MEVVISLQDLGIFILFSLITVLVIYLIVTLKNANNLLKKVDNIVESNKDTIKETMFYLPGITKETKAMVDTLNKGVKDIKDKAPNIIDNVNDITHNIKDSSRMINHTVETIGVGLDEAVTTVKNGSQDIITYITVIKESYDFIKELFSSRK